MAEEIWRDSDDVGLRHELDVSEAASKAKTDMILDLRKQLEAATMSSIPAQQEIERLRGEVVFGFYQSDKPLFTQGYSGAGDCELAEPVTADEVQGYVDRIAFLTRRVDELLATTNRYLERARAAENAMKDA